MEQDGHTPFAKLVKEAIPTMRMVSMAMAQNDRLDGAEINAEHCQVVQRSIRRHPVSKRIVSRYPWSIKALSNETPCSAGN